MKVRWAKVHPGMTSRAGHRLPDSRAHASDDSRILLPSGRKAWNLHDKLSHLCCESKLRTGLGLASYKVETVEDWKLADGWSRQSSSCAGSQRKPGSENISYIAPAGDLRWSRVYLSRKERTFLKGEKPSCLMALFGLLLLIFLAQHFFFLEKMWWSLSPQTQLGSCFPLLKALQ